MFRRRGRDADEEPRRGGGADEEAFEEVDGFEDDGGDPPRADAQRTSGPWDSTQLDDPGEGRVDVGGLLVPAIQNAQIKFTMTNDKVGTVVVVLEQTAIELVAFAAPRTEGIWSEVRDEIAKSMSQQGAVVDRGRGPFGDELRVHVQVSRPDGSRGIQVLRYIGADGPRWFLRGVIYGEGAMRQDASAVVDHIFRETVVVRGTEAMAPHDPIPLMLPAEIRAHMEAQAEAAAAQQQPGSQFRGDLNPFERGPEITEVR